MKSSSHLCKLVCKRETAPQGPAFCGVALVFRVNYLLQNNIARAMCSTTDELRPKSTSRQAVFLEDTIIVNLPYISHSSLKS